MHSAPAGRSRPCPGSPPARMEPCMRRPLVSTCTCRPAGRSRRTRRRAAHRRHPPPPLPRVGGRGQPPGPVSSGIAVAVVAESNRHLTEVLDTLERFVRSTARTSRSSTPRPPRLRTEMPHGRPPLRPSGPDQRSGPGGAGRRTGAPRRPGARAPHHHQRGGHPGSCARPASTIRRSSRPRGKAKEPPLPSPCHNRRGAQCHPSPTSGRYSPPARSA